MASRKRKKFSGDGYYVREVIIQEGNLMKAIILAAGQGTRLKKYTENLPKGMLSFMGKTIIERQIEIYRKCGIDNIIVIETRYSV